MAPKPIQRSLSGLSKIDLAQMPSSWRTAAAVAAATAGVVACVAVAVSVSGPVSLDAHSAGRLQMLPMQELNLGGYGGLGDNSAFSPVGGGMDHMTAIHDNEDIVSSLQKMLHPPKPKPKPAWEPRSGTVEFDGQEYATIPSDIMARFKQARAGLQTGGSTSAFASPGFMSAAAATPPSQAAVASASPAPSPSAKPPAWVVAEAKKLQQQAQARVDGTVTTPGVSPPTWAVREAKRLQQQAVVHTVKGPLPSWAVKEAKEDVQESPPPSSTGIASKAKYKASQPYDAAVVAGMEKQMAQMNTEHEEEMSALLGTISTLSKAVKTLKGRIAGKEGDESIGRSPGGSEAPAATRTARQGRGPGAVQETPEAVRKEEWDALRARLRADRQAESRGRAAVGPVRSEGVKTPIPHSRMSYFGILRQEQAAGASGDERMAPLAAGDVDSGNYKDLSAGYARQQQRDEEANAQGRPADAGVRESPGSKLSFWAQARNQEGMGKMAAIQRMLARAGAGRATSGLMLPDGVGSAAAVARQPSQVSAGSPCVAPRCTCVARGNQAVRAPDSVLALSQLQGLGAQAHCMYFSAHGPSGHQLSLRLEGTPAADTTWKDYGSVPTGCVAGAALGHRPSLLSVTDTVTGDSATFGINCQA